MPKHIWKLSVANDSGGTVLASTSTVEDDSESNFGPLTVAAGDTIEVDLPIDVSQVVSFYVYCDKAVTVKTNSNASPSQTFSLLAKEPLAWKTDDLAANPLTIDVTKWFVHNAGADDGSVKAGFLLDLSA